MEDHEKNPYRLLDLIPNERGPPVKRSTNHGGYSHDKKLELRLGLPGDEEEEYNNSKCWSKPTTNTKHQSMGYFSGVNHCNSSTAPIPPPWGYTRESSSQAQPCCTRMVELPQAQGTTSDMKNKAFSPPVAPTTAVPNSAQKRAAPAPVVGWPPIRSFRKNLASSSAAKSTLPDPPSAKPNEKPTEKNCHKGLFVKINMEGVPIGRKVDLNAYDSYDNLSSAVDLLFRGLLAAQRESCAGGTENKRGETAITGLLDGSGEYNLVYEDNEGDRMLAGDVPWHMFVSTVKRLRVLKSSELSTLSRVRGKGAMVSNE